MTVPDPHQEAPTLPLPRRVGKYVLLEQVLVGGMGVVYKAHDTDLDRIVALKMIKGGVLATDEEIQRFHQEARAIARLNHPNIVPVHEIGQEEGRRFFTMDFAWGGSLAQQQSRFVADPRAATALMEKIAGAVHYAHQRGILHRDLKPANILFDEHGVPWVSDFGLAKFADASLELTRAGQVLGTPSYMAPEQAAGEMDRISPQTDVWALGVLLYELLTGQRPFRGGSQEDQLHKIQTMEPPRPRSVNPALDRSLETIILRCLEKEPAQRYASAEALAADLARWLRSEPVMARPPSWRVRLGRAIRRYRATALRLTFAVAVLVLLAFVWKGLWPFILPRLAQTTQLREAPEGTLQKEVEAPLIQWRNRKVTLIGASGPPEGEPLWQLRGKGARTMLERNVFQVQAGEQPGMLELLPYAPTHYRLRAQVQHINGQPQGKVGIYFAHGKRVTGKGTTHCFFRVDFNDRFPLPKLSVKGNPPQSRVELTLSIFRETKETVFSRLEDHGCYISRQFTTAGEVERMPWQTLEAEVTPEWIRIFWKGEPISTINRGVASANGCNPKAELAEACDSASITEKRSKGGVAETVFLDAEPALGEGIGFYVERGTAAFRSVVIEPLTPR